ncbi:MAG: VWA domain-containing protein [Pleurocapsa minor HA4230-MV1]|nr:VWA domain-containing protein [Pleurocapsa minor HA4230-MV1]
MSGLILESRVDPSKIGRTVYFEFDNRADLPSRVYNESNFQSDVVKEFQLKGLDPLNSGEGFDPFKLNSAMLEEAKKIFDSGVTKFLYKGKPVVYGTDGQDILAPIDINGVTYPYQSDYKKNGLVFIGGKDIDYLSGGYNDDILIGNEENDVITGDAPLTSLFGGNDTLEGGPGIDKLDGGAGEDVAVFTDAYADENGDQNYTFLTEGATTKIGHTIGLLELGIDGVDTLKNIEWGEFTDIRVPIGNARLASATPSAPRLIPLPLEDGEIETETKQATDTTPNPNINDLPTPPHVSLSAPVAMLDGNVDYTLNISPYKPDTQYNISYILDTSASMDSGELQAAKNAYTDLTNYFIDNGLAENINFGVVKFSRNATLYKNLTANQAISTIQGLTSSPAIEGTEYDNALYEGFNFLSQSPLNALNTTNISYFVSDGRSDISTNFYHDDAQRLRRFSNVQAFGIYDPLDPGGVTSSQINFVDSNNGVLVNNVNDLSTELQKSGLAGKVNHVDILVNDVVVDTIQASELTDSPLGLTYKGSLENEGSIENLDVSIDAENVITAEVVFNDTTATTSVDYTVTAGDGKLTDASGNSIDESGNTSGDEDPFERIRNGGDTNDDITIGYSDRGANGGAGGDYIVGNQRDNQLDGGDGNDTIMGHGGNDTIITGTGTNKINGGKGIDTVLYGNVANQGNNIFLRRAANTVSYNNTDTLTEVEFIQFSDVRLSAKTLQVTPTLAGNDVSVSEPKSGNATAQFTLNLSTPAPVNVQFNYQTVDGDAVAGLDYIAKSGQITIAAGQTSATVDVAVIGDNQYDESTETFALNLSSITGATFADNQPEYTLVANIENRAQDLNLIGDAEANTLTGGAGDDLIDGQGNNDYLAGEGGNDTLIGGSGIDTLVGGSGSDSMNGGADNDTYVVDSAGDVVNETSTLATEIDTVQSSITYTLGTNLENLTLTGTSAINGTGNALNNSITGNTANNSLIGAEGNDTLNGAAGLDTMTGGAGNDTYVVDNAGDVVNETSTAATEIDTVQSSITHTLGANVENLSLTGTSGISAIGNTLNNSITGNAANNQIDGAAGLDIMTGGAGNDTYVVDNAGDVVNETSTAATEIDIDTVQSSITHTLGANVENLSLTGTSGISAIGNALNNSITGNVASNSISGAEGNDTLNGGAGNDKLYGKIGNDLFNGEDGDDYLSGLDGVDTLDGGAGSDSMNGGAGDDTYVVDNVGDVVSETSTLATEIDTVQSNLTYTLGANVENLTLTGTSAISAIGNALNNSITGNVASNSISGADGLDTLNGGAGLDTMTGGAGNDTYVVDNAGDVVSETSTFATEIDTVQSNLTYALGANLENLTLTGTSAINGTGNTLNNSITGNTANNSLNGAEGDDTLNGGAGNDKLYGKIGNDLFNGGDGDDYLSGLDGLDTLDGGSGSDSMNAGTGDDIYVVDNVGDVVSETSTFATEIDTVQSNLTYALGANLENLTLTGTSAINGTGNTLNNSITGNTANNSLNGAEGDDTLNGGAGNDKLYGKIGNDLFNGGDGDDYLSGLDGLDTLDGGSGSDSMNAGTGDDIYVVDNAGDVVSETSTVTTEIDTVQSNLTYTLGANLENLTLTGTSAIDGTGNTLNNFITGNTANNSLTGADGVDTLDGGSGSDSMSGGTGDDIYVVDNAGDVVSETSTVTTEIDTVQSNLTYTLGANLENFTLTGTSAIGGSGNALNNLLTGNIASNSITGAEGNDTVNGGAGNDKLYGKTGNDLLIGSQGDDYFSGLDGVDTLIGNEGNDSFNGGTGSDRFVYDTNAAFTPSSVGIDLLTDFTSGTDKIVLDKTTFTALGSVVGGGFSLASEFAVVGSDAATATANALIVYSSESDNLFYNQNGVTSGLGSGAQFATLSGISSLSANDFELQA